MAELLDLSYEAIYAQRDALDPSTGRIEEIADGIAVCSGLRDARINDAVVLGDEIPGIVLKLDEDRVGVGLLATGELAEGAEARLLGTALSAAVSTEIAGRVLDSAGAPLDGLPAPTTGTTVPVFAPSPALNTIEGVSRPLATGLLAVDAVTPVGRGQRQLILGDRQTGKTQLAIDAIINQRSQDVICLYVSIGKKMAEVASIVSHLRVAGALDYTTVIAAPADATLTSQYVAPYYGMAVAEALRAAGKDVLVVFDDLTNHADAYRSISLLLRRPPGREAYPGDIFYIHGSLLERAAQLSAEHGGGSITALPVVTTLSDDLSAYIPTNIVSITDGQIYLRAELANQGRMPAIDIGLSVSRVGSDAQLPVISQLSKGISFTLSQFAELQELLMYDGALSEHQRSLVADGQALVELFKQPAGAPRDPATTVFMLWAFRAGAFEGCSAADAAVLTGSLVAAAERNAADLAALLAPQLVPGGARTFSEQQTASLTELLDLARAAVS